MNTDGCVLVFKYQVTFLTSFLMFFLRVFKKTNGNGNVSNSYNVVVRRESNLNISRNNLHCLPLFSSDYPVLREEGLCGPCGLGGSRRYVLQRPRPQTRQLCLNWCHRFSSHVQRAPSKWTLPASMAGKVPGSQTPLNPVTYGTLKTSPSLQSTCTSPAPSATEATTWTWWGCPSGETSGSSASRCTRPRERTRQRPQCRNSSWRRLESRDMLFPFRCGNFTFSGALHSYCFICQSFFFSFISDANRSALFRLPAARAQRFWQGTFAWPTCVLPHSPGLFGCWLTCLFRLRPAVWTLRSKRTSPMPPKILMKSSRRSRCVKDKDEKILGLCFRLSVFILGGGVVF